MFTPKIFGFFILCTFCPLPVQLQTTSWYGGSTGTPSNSRWGPMTAQQIDEFKKSLGLKDVDRYLAAVDRIKQENDERVAHLSDADKAAWLEKTATVDQYVEEKTADSVGEINERAGVARSLYQTDIALNDAQVEELLSEYLTPTQARKKRQASTYAIWGKKLSYYFDSSVPETDRMVTKLAAEFWTNNTCVDFVESSTNTDRIRVYRGTGCFSKVGKGGGVQDLSLGPGCGAFYIATHEFGHALGFWHTQSRYDRDDWVNLNPALNTNNNYRKATAQENQNFMITYDYGGIMHYPPINVPDNNQISLVAKIPQYQGTMGQCIVSHNDLAMMNRLYNCQSQCTSGATCVNGGFRNSRDCSKCICPRGWGGAMCSERPAGCGATLCATTTPQTFNGVVGDGKFVENPLHTFCNYHIKAPAGMKVELTISSIIDGQPGTGCCFAGVEVKALNDHRYTGLRYCSNQAKVVVSAGNLMPVILYNRYYQTQVTASYRAVPASTASTINTAAFPLNEKTYTESNSCTGEGQVNRSSTSTIKSTTPTTTPAPTKINCTDNKSCPTWGASFCSSTAYTTANKRDYCPKMCGFCSCTDNVNCPTWGQSFCTGNTYTTEQKKSYCPNMCNLCTING